MKLQSVTLPHWAIPHPIGKCARVNCSNTVLHSGAKSQIVLATQSTTMRMLRRVSSELRASSKRNYNYYWRSSSYDAGVSSYRNRLKYIHLGGIVFWVHVRLINHVFANYIYESASNRGVRTKELCQGKASECYRYGWLIIWPGPVCVLRQLLMKKKITKCGYPCENATSVLTLAGSKGGLVWLFSANPSQMWSWRELIPFERSSKRPKSSYYSKFLRV